MNNMAAFLLGLYIALVMSGCGTKRVSKAVLNEEVGEYHVTSTTSTPQKTVQGHMSTDVDLESRSTAVFSLRTPWATEYRVNSSMSVRLNHPARSECSGKKIGLYTWDQRHWQGPESELIRHLNGRNARRYTCGDILINVADYTNPSVIRDREMLVPFMLNVRRSGNRGVIFLTYGDVVKRDYKSCKVFVDTFYDFVKTIPDNLIDEIKPIGISYDIEHFPVGVITDTLQYAQERKKDFPRFYPEGILVQCTIEGQPKPVDTDAVMRYADRALAMSYRNYISGIYSGGRNPKNDALVRARFMLKEQCQRCLDDEYAKKNYKAKITFMVETACKLGASCSYISFCAYDSQGKSGGIEYMVDVLDELDRQLVSSGLMTPEQKERLLSKTSPYAVHDWDWTQCFYHDPTDTNPLCRDYHSLASSCRKV